jgi:hypothetical protein
LVIHRNGGTFELTESIENTEVVRVLIDLHEIDDPPDVVISKDRNDFVVVANNVNHEILDVNWCPTDEINVEIKSEMTVTAAEAAGRTQDERRNQPPSIQEPPNPI